MLARLPAGPFFALARRAAVGFLLALGLSVPADGVARPVPAPPAPRGDPVDFTAIPPQPTPPIPAPEAVVVRPRVRHVVAAIGDSLTDARSQGGKYLGVLRARCPGSRFDNFGKGGEMVNQMRRRLPWHLVSGPATGPGRPGYTDLIVFGGVNDVCSDLTAHRTPDRIESDLGAMYAWARDHGIRVVAITIAPWGGFKAFFNPKRRAATLAVNEWIRAGIDAGRVDAVVDGFALLSCGDPDRLCDRFVGPFGDGIHFNARGHEVLGRALWEQVFSDCL